MIEFYLKQNGSGGAPVRLVTQLIVEQYSRAHQHNSAQASKAGQDKLENLHRMLKTRSH